MERKDANSPQFRSVHFERTAVNTETRTIEFALSSEDPYQRWWGIEVLSHDSAAVRLGRLSGGRHPLLVEHRTTDQVGVIEKAWISPDRMLRCIARFGNSARATEIFQDVADGIRSLVSVGYQIHSLKLVKSEGDVDTYMVDDWEPFEGSIVAVPADATVGIGRDGNEDTHLRLLINQAQSRAKGTNTMDKDKTTVVDDEKPVVDTAPKAPAQPADHRALERNAANNERQRAREISALGEKFGQRDAATKAIEDGTSFDTFRENVFNALEQSGRIKLAEPGKIGLSDKEAKSFRFANVILATMFPMEKGIQEMAAFELECSRAAQDKRQDSRADRQGSFCIPIDVLTRAMDVNAEEGAMAMRLLRSQASRGGLVGQRDLLVGTPTAGGNLVATELLASSFIDLLTNEMVMMQIGATMLNDLQGNIAIPRATAGATGYWVAENGSPTESQQAFDQVALTPKTVGAFTDFSRRLLLQSSIAVEAFIRMDIARTIALMIDLAAINGSGASNQPRGVLNTVGIGSVVGGTNGLAPTWDHIVDLETQCANANTPTGRRAYLTNTKVRGKLKRTQKFSGTNGQEIWQGDLNGNAALVSNQVPSNLTKGSSSGVCSAIAYGNWTDLIIGMWGGLDMMLDPYTGATAGTKRVVALQDVDVSVRYPTSFSAMLDALTV